MRVRAVSWNILGALMATTYLSPQQLKEFAQKVDEVAKKFPDEVVRIRHSFSRDWDGDPAINFRIVLTDKVRQDYRLSELSDLIGGALIKDLALYESEYSTYIPYFYYRGKSEEDKLKDPEWE
jgi:hypothetical protein